MVDRVLVITRAITSDSAVDVVNLAMPLSPLYLGGYCHVHAWQFRGVTQIVNTAILPSNGRSHHSHLPPAFKLSPSFFSELHATGITVE